MKRKQEARKTVEALALLSFLTLIVLGQTELAQAAGAAHAEAGIESLFWPAVNFVLYLSLMSYAYRKLARPVLRNNRIEVEARISRAANLLHDAEREYQAIESRMEDIEEEKANLIARLEQEGRTAADAVVVAANQGAEKMRRDTERLALAERNKTLAELRQAVIQRATSNAREQLKSVISEEKDAELRRETIRGL